MGGVLNSYEKTKKNKYVIYVEKGGKYCERMLKMKILIYLPDLEIAQKVFEYTVEIVKSVKFRGDVRNIRDFDLIKKELSENHFAYDTLLLDAQDRNCLNIARYVRSQNFVSSIIFVAVKGKRNPDIFLYRPSAVLTNLENNEQIKRALVWTCQEYIRANPIFTIRNKEEILRIPYSDILWFESRRRIVILHSRKQEISFYAKLSDVYELLPGELFLRCHQSYIVNCNKISRIDKVQNCIYLTTGHTIGMSKNYYQDVLSFCNSGRFEHLS